MSFFAPNIAKLEASRDVPRLLKALTSKDETVRKKAAEALGRVGDESSSQALRTALNDPNSDVCLTALSSLRQIEGIGISPFMLSFLDHQNRIVRKAAAETLGDARDLDVVAPLLTAVQREKDESTRLALWAALEQQGWEPAADALGASCWADKRNWNQCIAIGTPAVEPLIDRLTWRWDVAAVSAALGAIGDPRAVLPLVATYRSESQSEDGAGLAAVAAIRQIGSAAVQPLVHVLGASPAEDVFDRQAGSRQLAAQGLGIIGDPQGIGPLTEALNDRDREVRRTAVRALVEIGAPAISALSAALIAGYDEVREQAARGLGELGDPRAIPALSSALHDDRLAFRTVAGALVQIGNPEAVPPLADILANGTNDLRRAWAAEALARLGIGAAIPSLVAALNDQAWQVRKEAAKGLGLIGDLHVVPSLTIIAQDDLSDETRETAVAALAWIRSRSDAQPDEDRPMSQPGNDAGAQPTPEISVEAEVEVPAQPEPEAAVEAEVEVPAQPEPEAAVEAEVDVPAQPEPEAAVEAEVDVPAQPEPEAAVEAEVDVPAQPEPEAAVEAEVDVPAQPEPEALVAQPQAAVSVSAAGQPHQPPAGRSELAEKSAAIWPEVTPLGKGGDLRAIFRRGSLGEPYCSYECYKIAAPYASRKVGHGQCALCKKDVASVEGQRDYFAFPFKGRVLLICQACAPGLRAQLQSYHFCGTCGAEVR